MQEEASVPVPAQAQGQGQGQVLRVCPQLTEPARREGQPQAEAGQLGVALTSAAYPWVYQTEVFFPA